YVTHDQKEALSIADRMAILDGGHILQVGSPREVYRRPASRTVAHFIGETDFVPGTVVTIEGERAVVATAIGRFHGRLGDPGDRVVVGDAVKSGRASGRGRGERAAGARWCSGEGG